jgi:hypothetical protein
MKSALARILDADWTRVLGNARAAAGRIWQLPLHRYYTDHSVRHSERVIALLDGLVGGMMATDKRLCPTEAFVLLAAAYLHDIGMQDERSASGDLETIREAHHELTAEWIYRAAEDPAQAVQLGLPGDPGLVEAVALVAKGHRRVDLGAAEYDALVHGGDTLRLRLLAALLRFGDALDISHPRVDLELLKLMALPAKSQLHWWKCHYVSGVSIVDEYIRTAYRLPHDRPDYEGLIVPLVEAGIRREHAALEEIFRANAVKVALARPQVRWLRLVQPLPTAVEALARQSRGVTVGAPAQPSPDERRRTAGDAVEPPPSVSTPAVQKTVIDMRGQIVGKQTIVARDYVDQRQSGRSRTTGDTARARIAAAPPAQLAKGDGEPSAAELPLGSGNGWAVLVGVNEYEDKANYGRLYVCTQDVQAVREQLVAGGLDPERMRLLTENTAELPTRANILTVLKAVADATEPEDLLLFYYSGHGDEQDGESYLVARDGRLLVLGDTAVPVLRIKEIVQQAPARAKVIVLDACHSGADIGGKGPRPMSAEFIRRVFEQAEGLAILASCKQGQLSYEWKSQERSVFTHFLLDALQGDADRDDKGFVTVQDASRHVTNGVKLWASQHNVSQTPTLEYTVAGDIILCRYGSSG